MIEPFGQNLKPHPELGPLDIPESFPQSMSPVIAGKINFPGPFFNQGIDRLNRKRLFCLPEGWLLDITSRTLKIDPENVFDILLATCGDCIGAVKIIPI